MERDAAIQKIIVLATNLNVQLSESELEFYATKLVLDVLDYIHDDKFPETLCYTVAGALAKKFAASDDSGVAGGAPLKKITQDDTSYEFAVAETDTTTDAGTLMFDALKPRLSIYRRIRAL